jgi:hypothetical protein
MSFGEPDTTEEHERRITRCKSTGCNAKIIWLETESGRNIPVDADTVEPEDELYEHDRHASHWGTCKSAQQFRRPRNGN